VDEDGVEEEGYDSEEEQRPPTAPAKGKKKSTTAPRASTKASTAMVIDDGGFDDPFDDTDDAEIDIDDQPKRIPPELLRRLLHEFFDRGGTRVSSEANVALARYFDVFVQEAIARTMAERSGRFLEVSKQYLRAHICQQAAARYFSVCLPRG
jgi:centromere protein X